MAATVEQPTVRRVAHCRRCAGWLISAGSVNAGIGPTCAARERAEQRAAGVVPLTLFEVAA
ncbi:DUF6011 domain-containing protein [Nocardia salmonicida]|uniref:DUF6011 domain-containing protein n=1 Tax=Nocardia salmonicida TaxID=53431 RepID=UPI0007A3747A|nr:DUF6011 domain-containing protein [Nocardia salmonicida]